MELCESEGRYEGWYHYLLRKRPKRQPRYSRKKQVKTKIKERISIHLRSQEVDQRTRIGDWESDLAWFKKQKQAISVQYERKTMLTKIHRVLSRTSEDNEPALNQTIESFPADLFKTITFDNGSENACHTKIRDGYDIQTFFCDTYAAWQKGGVENTIGLIRRYLPKGTDMSTITDEQIQSVEDWINNRPRKKLNYLTPNEALRAALNH